MTAKVWVLVVATGHSTSMILPRPIIREELQQEVCKQTGICIEDQVLKKFGGIHFPGWDDPMPPFVTVHHKDIDEMDACKQGYVYKWKLWATEEALKQAIEEAAKDRAGLPNEFMAATDHHCDAENDVAFTYWLRSAE